MKNRRPLRVLTPLFASCSLLLLAGCGLTSSQPADHPQWIEAPLTADGQTDASGYQGFGSDLSLDAGSSAFLQFSLSTLPNSSNPATTADYQPTQSNYQLTADKVVSARLVFYVDRVDTAGSVSIFQPFYLGLSAQNCLWSEYSVPACARNQDVGYGGNDADNPTSPLQVTDRGFYSFDVTDAVKAAITAQLPAVQLRANSANGAFRIASKETATGENALEHNAHLLITLNDAFGTSSRLRQSNDIQASQPDSVNTTATNLLVTNAAQPAVALLGTNQAMSVLTVADLTSGTTLNAKLIAHINSPVAAGPAPALQFFNPGTGDQSAATWNSLQPQIASSIPFASASVDTNPAAQNQVVTADVSGPFDKAFLDAANAGQDSPPLWTGVSTNPGSAVTLDGTASTDTSHPPRINLAVSPLNAMGIISPIPNDSGDHTFYASTDTYSYTYFNLTTSGFSVRIGQPFPIFYLADLPAVQGSHVFVAMPISVLTPASGASAVLTQADFDTSDFYFNTCGTCSDQGGYTVTATANGVVGTYPVVVSMMGHNRRTTLTFTNLPLPTPSLTGAAIVEIPSGQPSVVGPFTLNVADSVTATNPVAIDTTTDWHVTSSDAGDVMPADFTQTNGSHAFNVTFSSTGPRTLTVTSKGDATVTATFKFVVKQATTTTLSASPSPSKFTQQVTFSATVAGSNPGGTVTFCDGGNASDASFCASGTVLCSGVAPSPATCSTSSLASGVHVVTAQYSGDSNYAPSISPVFTQMVNAADTVVIAGALPTITYGQSATFTANVSTSPASSQMPTGTLTISDGTVSCSYGVPTSTGCSLKPTSAGTKTLTYTYASNNNSDFASSALNNVPLTVRQAVLTITADSTSRAYGAANPAFSASYGGFVNNDTTANLTTLPSFSSTATSASPVGNGYTITPSGAAAANYTISYATGTLTITRAPLTITASNQSRGYGQADPVFTWTSSGFVNSETNSVLSGTPILSSTDTPTSAVNTTYPITIAPGTLAATNYGFTFVNGTLTIGNKASQTIVFSAQPVQAYSSGGTFAINPLATSATPNAISYASTTSGVCTVSGTTVAILATGTCTVVASQAGDNNYLAATASQDIAIGLASQTITNFIAALASPTFVPNGTFTVSATGGASGNAVTFSIAPASAGVCSAGGTNGATITMLGAGTCSVQANETGNVDYAAASQITLNIVIGKTPASITLTSSANPSAQGSWVTFTATVGAGSTPGSIAPAGTLASASVHTAAAQGTGSVQAIAAAATGTVSFTDGSTPLGAVSLTNGTATFATPFTTPGSHLITASYAGDAVTAAASITIAQAVGAADPVVPAPMLSTWMLALLGSIFGGTALVRVMRVRDR